MFVRIQREDTSTIYECGKVDLIPNDRPHRVALQMEGVPGMNTVGSIIHKGKASLYFMNDDGQTIDVYEWPVTDTGVDDVNGDRIYTSDKVEAESNTAGDSSRGQVKQRSGKFYIEFEDFSEELESFYALHLLRD